MSINEEHPEKKYFFKRRLFVKGIGILDVAFLEVNSMLSANLSEERVFSNVFEHRLISTSQWRLGLARGSWVPQR